MTNNELIEGKDYYYDKEGLFVFTEKYHLNRGFCCRRGCKHCPYEHKMLKKKTIVVHSGGMDSSLCLAEAIREFGVDQVLSVSFSYGQRHSLELDRAAQICLDWKVDRTVLDIHCLNEITENSLTRHSLKISHNPGEAPNSLVVGRNGLMAQISSIHAYQLGANSIYMGVIEVESANSGYRDCSRKYMDLLQEVLRLDLDLPGFEIRTPLVKMTKKQTLEWGHKLGVLEYLLNTTITCYQGIEHQGCLTCPACVLRNQGIAEFLAEHPDFNFSYRNHFAG